MRKGFWPTLLIGFAIGGLIAVAIFNLAPAPPPIVSITPRPAGTWRFQPQPDMTPAEAAASIALMVMGPDFIPAVGERIEAMPPELRRHWLAPETK